MQRETYHEQTARLIDERMMREEGLERAFEKAARLEKDPVKRKAAFAYCESVYRAERMDARFSSAKKKLKTGKSIWELHRHEIEALQDVAELSDISFDELLIWIKNE